jgi:hypothetical protein
MSVGTGATPELGPSDAPNGLCFINRSHLRNSDIGVRGCYQWVGAELRDHPRDEQPEKFRREAEECRRNAEEARNPIADGLFFLIDANVSKDGRAFEKAPLANCLLVGRCSRIDQTVDGPCR